MSDTAEYECPHCGWSGERTRTAGEIDLCPECLATGLEEVGP